MRNITDIPSDRFYGDLAVGQAVVAESRLLNFVSKSRELVRRSGPIEEIYRTGTVSFLIVDGLPFRSGEVERRLPV